MNVQIQQRGRISYANTGYLNPNTNHYGGGVGNGEVRLSSQAHRMMRMMRMRNLLQNGGFGHLMSMFGAGAPNGREGGSLRTFRSPFGRTVRASSPQVPTLDGSKAAQAARGQARELKPGETVRGTNGSLVRWGKDGDVNITYKDRHGRDKNIRVKDGMLSIDGGKPRKLGNTGQLLKLPNGDVVGLGNNPQAQGQKLCRVVMADSPDQIKCEPASATNIYDIAEMERQQTRVQGGGVSLNYSQSAHCTPFGIHTHARASLSVFRGLPVTTRWSETVMNLVGNK